MNAYPAVAASTAHTICRPPRGTPPPPGQRYFSGPGAQRAGSGPGIWHLRAQKIAFRFVFSGVSGAGKDGKPLKNQS